MGHMTHLPIRGVHIGYLSGRFPAALARSYVHKFSLIAAVVDERDFGCTCLVGSAPCPACRAWDARIRRVQAMLAGTSK
jgi:hypothetical protein